MPRLPPEEQPRAFLRSQGVKSPEKSPKTLARGQSSDYTLGLCKGCKIRCFFHLTWWGCIRSMRPSIRRPVVGVCSETRPLGISEV